MNQFNENRVNYKMIQLARESRGKTQIELSDLLSIPQSKLSRLESGTLKVKEEDLDNLANALNYPKDFFYQDNQICTTDTHYRKAVTLDQKTKLKAEAIMNIYKFNIEEMLNSLELSNKNIPIINEQFNSPEKIAIYLRSYWNIAKGPIENLAKIVEENGIIIIQMDFETDKIDGRTIITDTGHPIIFINKNSSGDRQRQNIAHELGHVILHLVPIPVLGINEEDEAWGFASEFLMPLAECQYDLTSGLNLGKLADLKRHWKVSMASIVMKANKCGFLSVNQTKYLYQLLNGRGWKKSEPIPIPKENTTLINRMANMFIDNLEYSKEELASLFKLSTEELEDRYFKNNNKLRVA